MTESEILDQFGKHCMKAFDKALAFPKSDLADLKATERHKHLFKTMTSDQKNEFERVFYNVLEGMLFDFLKIFEEYPEFKIIFESESKQVDLVKISEMLKAEPIIEGGWIERFSKYADMKL